MGVEYSEAQPPLAKSWADVHTPGSRRVLASQPSASCPQPPHVPDHELLRKIGGGSYGEVWLARNVVGTLRAVKIVSRRDFSEAYPFEREFKGIQKYEPISRSQEGLIDILQIGRNDREGYFYYVMELADDSGAERSDGVLESWSSAISPAALHDPSSYTPRTLRSELKARGRLHLEECIQLGLSLSSALEHLHRSGPVHRDIKPSNIIFVQGAPKLADIGLVADVAEARSFVGTIGFIPPEGPGSAQADVYSLGKVLYEMLTGKDRQEFPALPEEFRNGADPRLREFNQVILQACEGDPRHRYPSAQAMHDDLARVAQGRSARGTRSLQRRPMVIGTIGLALLGLVGAMLAFSLSRPNQHTHAPIPEAVRLYKLGLWYQQQLTDESLKKAIDYLNQAVQADPRYPEPYATLVGLYTWSVPGVSEEERQRRISQIAEKLLRLAPNRAEGYCALSYSKYLEGDLNKAEQEIRRALRLNPDYAQAHTTYCYYLSLLGRVAEASEHGRRAQELDPQSRIAATIAGYSFITARQFDLAIAQFRKALELDQNFPLAHQWIGKGLEAKGDYLAALEAFEKSAILSGEDGSGVRERFDQIRQANAHSGPRGYWLKVLEIQLSAEASHEERKSSDADHWCLDGIYAQLGETNKALEMLERDSRDEGGDTWLKLEPLYEPLRNEPRFKVLLKRAGLER